MCFQIHLFKFTRLITQLVQLQWLPHPPSTAENKTRVLSVQRTKRNQGLLFVDFPFCVFFYNIPLKMSILQFWKVFNSSLLSLRKLYPLWNGIYFSVFSEQSSWNLELAGTFSSHYSIGHGSILFILPVKKYKDFCELHIKSEVLNELEKVSASNDKWVMKENSINVKFRCGFVLCGC